MIDSMSRKNAIRNPFKQRRKTMKLNNMIKSAMIAGLLVGTAGTTVNAAGSIERPVTIDNNSIHNLTIDYTQSDGNRGYLTVEPNTTGVPIKAKSSTKYFVQWNFDLAGSPKYADIIKNEDIEEGTLTCKGKVVGQAPVCTPSWSAPTKAK
jgi:hypothetical protein